MFVTKTGLSFRLRGDDKGEWLLPALLIALRDEIALAQFAGLAIARPRAVSHSSLQVQKQNLYFTTKENLHRQQSVQLTWASRTYFWKGELR